MITFERKNRSSAKAQLAEYLRSAIREKKFQTGQRLPTTQEFVKKAGVSSNTVRLAMSELISEGILKATPGLGTFVIDPAQAKDSEISVKRIGILPIFHRLEVPFSEERYRVESAKGFLEECEKIGAISMALPSKIVDMEPEKAAAVLGSTNCQGLVWLYPEANDWKIIEYLHSLHFPIVVTKRGTIDSGFACVGADYEKAGSNLGKYLIDNGCEKVLLFNYFWQTQSNEGTKYAVGPIGIKQGIARAYEMVSGGDEGKIEQVHLNHISESESRTILEKLESHAGTPVVFVNPTHLYNIFILDSQRATSLLKDRKVCVVGNRSFLAHIAPYVKGLDIRVLVDPFEEIARCAAQKLVTLIDGHLAGTTTLVNVEFKAFSEI